MLNPDGPEHDRIYNRLREHEAHEHQHPCPECPDCEGWGAEGRRLLGEAAQPNTAETLHGADCPTDQECARG